MSCVDGAMSFTEMLTIVDVLFPLSLLRHVTFCQVGITSLATIPMGSSASVHSATFRPRPQASPKNSLALDLLWPPLLGTSACRC